MHSIRAAKAVLDHIEAYLPPSQGRVVLYLVIDAIVRRDQIRVLVGGMTVANDLGLTNAVPAKVVVHTDARLKSISLGQMEIIFKPTATSKSIFPLRQACTRRAGA